MVPFLCFGPMLLTKLGGTVAAFKKKDYAKLAPNLILVCPKQHKIKCKNCTTALHKIAANKVPRRCWHYNAQMFSWVGTFQTIKILVRVSSHIKSKETLV